MVRIILLLILVILIARAFWRIVDNIIAGATGQAPGARGGADRVRQMVRDPVCGTFVVPDNALTLADRSGPVYFCSAACRDKYLAKSSTGSDRPDRAAGRTA